MFSLIREGHILCKSHSKITTFWGDHLFTETLFKLSCQIVQLSNVKTTAYDCCVNSCCAFIGTDYKTADSCPYCHEPRFDECKQSRNTFQYIHLTSQIKLMFLNTSLKEKLSYHANFKYNPDSYNDVFSGSHYQCLTSEHVVIDGTQYPHQFFSHPHDIALGILTDGFQIFRCGSNALCWPIIALNFNLPPTEQTHIQNILPITLIPGP